MSNLSPRAFVERALVAYIQNVSLDGARLTSMTGRFAGDESEHPLTFSNITGEVGENGELPEEWTKLRLPAVVVACPRPEAQPGGYDLCPTQIAVITTPDEIEAPERVQARIGWLADLFHEDNLEDIRGALNDPAAAVRGGVIIGIERDDEEHGEDGRHVMSTLKLKVYAAAGAL